MAKFDESKLINSLHADEAILLKKYYFCDSLHDIKNAIENEDIDCVGELTFVLDDPSPFQMNNKYGWQFIYPYEEQTKLMTNRQLAEWLSKGHGEFSKESYSLAYLNFSYLKVREESKEVDEDILIRSWGSDEWVKPSTDIYERDCK